MTGKSGHPFENTIYRRTTGRQPQNKGDDMTKTKSSSPRPSSQLPSVIRFALDRIERLFSHRAIVRPHDYRIRDLRSDFKENLTSVLKFLISTTCLAREGTLATVKHKTGRVGVASPITISQICQATHMKKKTVDRCMAFLKSLDLIAVTKQEKQMAPDGEGIIVSSVFRRLTERFWKMLGLLDQYKSDVAHCKKAQKLDLSCEHYRVTARLKAGQDLVKIIASSPPDKREQKSIFNLVPSFRYRPYTKAEMETQRQKLLAVYA